MKIILASDHAGYELKESLKIFLNNLFNSNRVGKIKIFGESAKSIKVYDVGPHNFVKDDDYPDYISKASDMVSKNPEHVKAIIIGGSGQGEAMCANRYRNVRATTYYGGNSQIISLSREHNDSNVLSLGARYVSRRDAEKAVVIWLETAFSGDERHVRRIKKIECMPHSHSPNSHI